MTTELSERMYTIRVRGTILDAGDDQTLTGTFTPTYEGYSSITKSTSIDVDKATPTVSVSDAGGTYDGSAFPATATVTGVVTGVDDSPASSLQSVTPTLTYYSGSSPHPAVYTKALRRRPGRIQSSRPTRGARTTIAPKALPSLSRFAKRT